MAHFAHFIEFLYKYFTLPPSKSSPFSIYPFFPFTFHTHCISSTYGEPNLFLLSHCFHTIRFVIQSEAKDDNILNRLFLIHTRKVRPYQFLQLFGHYTYLPSYQM